MRVVQIEPGPCPTLIRIRAAIRQKFHACRARHVSGDERQFRKCVAQNAHRVADAFRVPVRGGDGNCVHAAFDKSADVFENAFFVEFAKSISRGRNRRAADKMKIRVARGLELRRAFERDALHVAQRDQPAQIILFIHDEQLVDAEMLGEKFVGARNRVFAQFLFQNGLDLRTRRQRIRDFHFCVARLDDVAGQKPDKFSLFIHDGKSPEREFFLLDHRQHVADELLRRNLDWLLDQTVDVVLHAADFGQLLPLRHIVMDEA